MAEYIDKNRLILCMNDWMLQNAPVKAGDDTTRADTILDAIKMVEDSPAADVRENVKRTQADRIRAMSDEELARFIADMVDHPWCSESGCPLKMEGACAYPEKPCDESALDWLKSPVEEEE